MCATLGGRAAEEITFGKISTGALSDLEKITKQAYAMITVYGLNDKIGNISYYDSTGANEYGFTKPYSEKTAETIDAEVSKMIETSYARAKDLLKKNQPLLKELAEKLLDKEVIFKEDLEIIFGKRTFDKDLLSLEKTTEAPVKTEDSKVQPAIEKPKEEKKEDKNPGPPEKPLDTLF